MAAVSILMRAIPSRHPGRILRPSQGIIPGMEASDIPAACAVERRITFR